MILVKNKDNKSVSAWLDLITGVYKDGEIIELPVLTGSMMPLLVPGKKIKIICMFHPKINIGDIVIFKEGNKLNSHRVILKILLFNRLFLYQMGDLNRFGNWINSDKVVGKVISTQDEKGVYTDLRSPQKQAESKKKTAKQIYTLIYNILLIGPRSIKRWLRES